MIHVDEDDPVGGEFSTFQTICKKSIVASWTHNHDISVQFRIHLSTLSFAIKLFRFLCSMGCSMPTGHRPEAANLVAG